MTEGTAPEPAGARGYSANIERFTGFAAQYNGVRPGPPEGLASLLVPMARCGSPSLVVDLGSGTGLSTRYWSPRSGSVVGVEPSRSMRDEAERTRCANVSYRDGLSHDTALPAACADIVVCGQSLHWMDPAATFAECARILRPGGVFAAYDYDWPPATSFWEADRAFGECMERARGLERLHAAGEDLRQWDKEGHLARMRASGRFRHVFECLLSHRDAGGAERLVGVFMSQGYVRSLLKRGLSEDDLHVPRLREAASGSFGRSESVWHWSARVRIGVA
jgi:SAM-dependent methyltransferase